MVGPAGPAAPSGHRSRTAAVTAGPVVPPVRVSSVPRPAGVGRRVVTGLGGGSAGRAGRGGLVAPTEGRSALAGWAAMAGLAVWAVTVVLAVPAISAATVILA